MLTNRRTAFLLAGAVASLAGRPARSQATAEAAGEEALGATEQQAAALFDVGVQLSAEEDWAGALAAFTHAHQLSAHPAILYNIGVCLQALGDEAGATGAFAMYLELGGGEIAPERRREVEGILRELQLRTAAVSVDVDVPGAEVAVDGVVRGVSPLAGPLFVNAGEHVFAARAAGAGPVEVRATVAGGETRTVTLVLGGASAAERDGVHEAWFWTTAGAAGALAVAGAVTGALTLAEQSDFGDAATRCEGGAREACLEGYGIADRHDDYRLATNILLPAAGAFAVGALVLFFFTEFGGGESPPPAVAVDARPGTGGLTLRFAF